MCSKDSHSIYWKIVLATYVVFKFKRAQRRECFCNSIYFKGGGFGGDMVDAGLMPGLDWMGGLVMPS